MNTATGYYCYGQEGLFLPGRGVPLQFQPAYSSDVANITSRLGNGWTHNYNMYIDLDEGQNYRVHEENGSVVTFAPDFSHPSRVMATLAEESSGELVFTRLHGQDKFYFKAVEGRSLIYRLEQIIDRNGHKTSLEYVNDLLDRVADDTGRALHFDYYSNGLLQKVTEQIDGQNGRDVSFEYDPNPGGGGILRDPPSGLDPAPEADLVTITDVGDTRRAFMYDSQHHLETVTEPRNGVDTEILANSYGGPGGNQVYRQDYPMSRQMEFGYSSSITGSQTRITDTLGLVTLHNYSSNMLESVTQYPGDHQAKWSYSYQLGTPWIASVTDPLTHTWASTWDTNGNLLSETDPLQRTTSYAYNSTNDLISMTNAASLTTTYTYDTYGNLTSVSRPLTETGQTVTTQYGYYYTQGRVGDLLSVTDPLTHTWHYSYDAYGYPLTATDPLGNTSYTYFDAVGRLHSSVDPNGNPTVYFTNDYGDPLSVTDALNHTTIYTYDAVRNLTSTRDAKSNVTTNAYNLNNELTRVTHPDGTHSDYVYDGLGRVTSQSNGLGQATIYTYDDLTRQYHTNDPLGRTHQYRHDLAGRLDREQDASGRYTNYYYYPDNRLQTVDYNDGATHDVGYTYDNKGLRDSMTDGMGTVSYGYDSLNRLTSTSRDFGDGNIGGQVNYGYDLADNITSILYPANPWDGIRRKVTRTFNAANQMDSLRDFFDFPTTFAYDNNGNLEEIQTALSTGTLTRNFGFDNANQIISTSSILDALSEYSLAITYTRDPVGMVKNAYEYDNGSPIAATHVYTYDKRSRLTDSIYLAVDPSQNTISTWDMDAASQVTRTTVIAASGASYTTTYQYDDANQLGVMTTITTSAISEPNASASVTQIYTFENSLEGNRLLQLLNPGSSQPVTTTYEYDLNNQLTSYNHESLYNPFRINSGYYRYDGDRLRLGRDTAGTNFGFTSTITSTWDSSVLVGDLPLLLRDSKVSGGFPARNEISYIYGPGGIPLAQFSEYRPLSATSGGNGNGNLGAEVPNGAAYEWSYLLTDQAGSVRALVDGNGQVSGEFRYDDYGYRDCYCNGNYPFGFTGQYTDDESGMLYLRAREYDPLTQQFLSRDPLQEVSGQPYVYANRNPVNYIDPTGTTALFQKHDEGLGKSPSGAGKSQTPIGAGSSRGGAGGGTARGLIEYGKVDALGHPTGVQAIITRNMPKGSYAEAYPEGWVKGVTGELYDRAHLLAQRFGGSGYTRTNLAIVLKSVNRVTMRRYEDMIARAVASGEVVWYRVTPIYRGVSNEPYAITLQATGSRGLTVGVSIFNR
ncbi:MAG TPA: DNA/RNA non-specific endonuclease [Chloroflexia bacterium]|nr:DNA/RNA non-specific endonuclease [Chloroflexia bacterium]